MDFMKEVLAEVVPDENEVNERLDLAKKISNLVENTINRTLQKNKSAVRAKVEFYCSCVK